MKKRTKQITALVLSAVMSASAAVSVYAAETSKFDPNSVPELELDISTLATAKDNGIDLPEIKDGTLKLKASIATYQMSSEGTQIQKLWQEAMEHYLGCKVEIEWQRTNSLDYASNELVVLQSGGIPDMATVTKGAAVNEYGDDGILLNLSDYMDYMKYYPEYMQGTSGGEDYAKITNCSYPGDAEIFSGEREKDW